MCLKRCGSVRVTGNKQVEVPSCKDTSDAVELFPPQSLYLKPIARLNVSVQLPSIKEPGKTISNWEVMEKLKNMIKPEQFIVLKVSKSTLEFIRFEAEIENRSNLKCVISRLDTRTIKLSGFSELLKIRAAEAKIAFPTRHTWDAYFRDARNMNEMKPGERPDTIHLSNLPCNWFATKQEKDVPSEYVFRKVFEVFGEVRCVDIPAADPYRSKMKAHISGMKTFSFGQELSFDGYIQYKEYICFVKAMDALRGMKLLYRDGDKAFTASVKVDFDKTKHLSDLSIRRRRIEREKLIEKEREIEERERRQQELEEQRKEQERLQKQEEKRQKEERRRKREEKRKHNELMKLQKKETEEMNKKIAVEERKLLIAQRKLESIRLLDELFERIKVNKLKELAMKEEEASRMKKEKKDDAGKAKQKKQRKKKAKKMKPMDKERELRNRLVKKYKAAQSEQKKKLKQTIQGKNKLRSVLASSSTGHEHHTSSSSDKSSSSSSSSDVDSTSEHRETSWKEKQDFDGKKYHVVSEYKDRHWYQYPYGGYPNMRFPYRGRFFPRRRGYYVPRWQRYPRGGRGAYYSTPYAMEPNLYYDSVTKEYYKYFQKLAKRDGSSSGSSCHSRSVSHSKHSRSRSHSRHSRSKSHSRHSRSKSHSKSRSKHSRSRSHSRHSRSRSHSRHSRSRSLSRHSRLKSHSRSKSRSKCVSKSWSMSDSRSRSWSQKLSLSPSRSRSYRCSTTRSRSVLSDRQSRSEAGKTVAVREERKTHSKKKKKKHKKDKAKRKR